MGVKMSRHHEDSSSLEECRSDEERLYKAMELLKQLSFSDCPELITVVTPNRSKSSPAGSLQEQQQQQKGLFLQRSQQVGIEKNSRSSSSSSKRRQRRLLEDEITETTWKKATDAATGRTYYYDAVTRKTQWEKVCRWEIFDFLVQKRNPREEICAFVAYPLRFLFSFSLLFRFVVYIAP
jgi:hypothetical protein